MYTFIHLLIHTYLFPLHLHLLLLLKVLRHINTSHFIPAPQGSFYLFSFLYLWRPSPSVWWFARTVFNTFNYFLNTPYLVSNKSPDRARWLPDTLQANWISGLQSGWKVWDRTPGKSHCAAASVWLMQAMGDLHWTWVHLIAPATSISTNSGHVGRGSLS